MKQLKVGDRIRMEGVVVRADNTILPYCIAFGEQTKWISQNTADQCEVLEPQAEAQPEKWEPKVGEMVAVNNTEDNIQRCDNIGQYVFTTRKGTHIIEMEDGGLRYGIHIRPIAKTVTMEEELDSILERHLFNVGTMLRSDILSWYNRHNPTTK